MNTTVSIGMASLSQLKYQNELQSKNLSQKSDINIGQMLLGKADEALYQAKQTGRNQVVIKKIAH